MKKLQQSQPIAPPQLSDKDLQQFSAIIQGNLFDLWNEAHTHTPTTTELTAWNALTTDAARIKFLAAQLGF
jgi:hypothetical protein